MSRPVADTCATFVQLTSDLCSYMFDIIYITWFVHVTTALVSTKFWYLYLSVSSGAPESVATPKY